MTIIQSNTSTFELAKEPIDPDICTKEDMLVQLEADYKIKSELPIRPTEQRSLPPSPPSKKPNLALTTSSLIISTTASSSASKYTHLPSNPDANHPSKLTTSTHLLLTYFQSLDTLEAISLNQPGFTKSLVTNYDPEAYAEAKKIAGHKYAMFAEEFCRVRGREGVNEGGGVDGRLWREGR